jgi:hypothetical protein
VSPASFSNTIALRTAPGEDVTTIGTALPTPWYGRSARNPAASAVVRGALVVAGTNISAAKNVHAVSTRDQTDTCRVFI